MKKLINFTGQASPHLSRKLTYLMLLLITLMGGTGSAWADEVTSVIWDYNCVASLSYADQTLTANGLDLTVVNNGGGTSDYVKNDANEFLHWNGASSSTIRNAKFVAPHAGVVTVEYKSNNSSATDRVVAVGKSVVTGSDVATLNSNDNVYKAGYTNGYTVMKITTNVDKGDVYIYNANGGCNIKSITYTYTTSVEYKADDLDANTLCSYNEKYFSLTHSNARVTRNNSTATVDHGSATFTNAFLPGGSSNSESACYTLTPKVKAEKIVVYYTLTDGSFSSNDQSKGGSLKYKIGSGAEKTEESVDGSNKVAYVATITQDGGIDANTVVKIYSSGNRLAIFSFVVYPDGEPAMGETYTITYNPGANGTGSIAAGEKEQGVDFTLSSSKFTRDGYTQTGWATTDGGAKAYELGGSYTTDADITLYPFWTEDSRPLLIFHANGGVGEDYTQPFTPNNNTGFRFLANQFTASSDAYEFAGWALTSDGPVRWKDQDNPKVPYETNVDLYAVWILKAGYTVSYDMKGHGASIPSVTNQKKMTYLNMPQLGIVDGYYFDGWYTDAGLSSAAARGTTLIANTTLYAKWTQFTDYTYTTVAVTDNATTNGTNLKNAINTANGQAATVRKVIYVPNGTYDFGEVVGPTIKQHNITIVGESRDGVILKNNISTNNSSTCATITVEDVKNVYLENLTVQNAYDYLSKSGIACAFYDRGTNTIIKNLKLLSYQDTYTTAKGDKMRYVLNCEIHGLVDFICGEGKTLFDRCTLVAESDNGSEGHGSATLTASQSSIEYFDDYGFVFKDCTVESHVNSISLGRAWNNQSMTAFINTTFTGTGSIMSDRWTTLGMAAGKSAYKFYEYGSTGTVGNAATPASKILSFKDNTGKVINANFETVLPASEAALYTMTNIYPYWIANNYYTISKEQTANGTVNVYPTYVAAGDKVKAFATPNPGNVKEAWNVYRTGNEASKVTVDANDMFVMPAYNTTVSANFVDDGTVGRADCETPYAEDFSQPISIAAGKTRHITFNNKSKGDANYNNFYLIAMGSSTPSVAEGQNYMRLRADWFEDVNSSTTVRLMKPTAGELVEADWRNDMKDADVDMYVSYSGSRFYVNATITAKGGSESSYTYTAESPVINEAANPAYLFLSIQKAYLSNIKVDDETDANAVSVSYGANGTSATMTNSIGMNVSNGTCVQAGEQIKFSATPASGYKFSNWTTGTSVVSTDNPYQASITAPITLTANFVTEATEVLTAPEIDASNTSAVTITSAGSTAIYYTTDGTVPTTESTQYTGAINLSVSTPIRAIAVNGENKSAETIKNVEVNTNPGVKLLGSASLSSATLKPYEWNITEGANAGTYSLSCDDSGRKRALWTLFSSNDAYKVSGNYQYHLNTPLGFKVTKIAIIGRSNSSDNNAYVTIDGHNIGDLKKSSPEVIKTLTYEVAKPEYGKVFNIQADREMLINIELWGTMSTVFTAEATSAQPAMGSVSVSEAVVASGSNVTFYAQAEDGYTFVNWTNASGNVVSTDAEYTTSASANLSLVANFRVAGSEDATLTSLSYNGINIPLVEDQYVYNVRALSTVMPNVVAVANDANATINYTQATDYNGTATIEVVAEAGNVETYTVNFTESSSVPETKVTWDFTGGDSQSAFTGTITSAGSDTAGNLYAMYVKGTGNDNYGKYIFFNGSRTIDFTGITGTGKLTIVTGNPSGTPADSYTITQGSETLASCSLAVNSENVSDAVTYDASKTYTINIGKSVIKSITWTPYEIQNGKEITSAIVAGGKATISGDKITYVVPYAGQNASTTIPVTLTLSSNATATSASPFPATITSGTEFNVTLGVESGTKVNSTVTVTAENGVTQTYSVEILRGSMATSSVLYVETDGQNEYLTKEHIGNAKYASISYDGTGENTYDGVKGTYYDLKNSNKYIQITETGAKFYNVYVQHNNGTATRKLALYVDGVKVKDIEVGPRVLNESGILPINADGTNDGENHTIKLVGAGSDVYPVKIKFYTTKQAASLTPAALAIKMGKVTDDIAVTATSGAVVAFDESASAAANEYVSVSYSNGSLSLTPKKAGETTLYFDIAAAGAFNAKDNAEMHITISKQDLTLTYSPSSYECNLDDEESTRPTWVQPTLVAKDEDGNTVTGLTYTYFSDDQTIATVNPTNGTITPIDASAVGSAGIYATFAGDGTYNDAQAVFTVKYVQGFTYQITDKTKFAGDKTNPAVREQIVLKDKENNPLVYATFGGWKRNSNTYHRPGATADRTDKWSKPTRYTGTIGNKPLYVDGFEFATSGADNACEETMAQTLDPSHEDYAKSGGYFRIPDDGGKYPFTLPVRGAYMTFEPTKNGQLTVYILQNGAFNSGVDADGNSNVIPGQFRKHSFYVADQEGNIYHEGSSYGGLTYVSKQNVSNYYQNSHPTDKVWTLSSDSTTILDENGAKKYDADVNSKDVAMWPEYYLNYSAEERKRISDNWEDEETGHGKRQMVTVLDDGSHFLAMKAYAKYSMYVLAGQTYYIFSNRSKLGFCGMNFVPDATNLPDAELALSDKERYVAPTLIESGENNTTGGNNTVVKHGVVSVPQYKKISLNRTFAAGNWNTIYLPFVMTEKEVRDVFGENTQLILLDNTVVDESGVLELQFVYHEIQSILPGYPYLIKPSQPVGAGNIIVYNKVLDPGATQMVFTCGDYSAHGTVNYCTPDPENKNYAAKLDKGDIYINGGNLYVAGETPVYSKGYRAYIDYIGTAQGAKKVRLTMRGGGSNNDQTTDIDIVQLTDEAVESLGINRIVNGVYNINGQKISGSAKNLPAGVYIVNGKKMVVK